MNKRINERATSNRMFCLRGCVFACRLRVLSLKSCKIFLLGTYNTTRDVRALTCSQQLPHGSRHLCFLSLSHPSVVRLSSCNRFSNRLYKLESPTLDSRRYISDPSLAQNEWEWRLVLHGQSGYWSERTGITLRYQDLVCIHVYIHLWIFTKWNVRQPPNWPNYTM